MLTAISILGLALSLFFTVRLIRHGRQGGGKIFGLIACLLLAVLCVILLWFSVYYRAGDEARGSLPESEMTINGMKGWFFDGPGEETAMIFYPGAKVEAAAYTPLLSRLAADGLDVFLVEMPLHFAFLGINAAEGLTEEYAYSHWILAGHSLGGVAASSWAAKHPETVDGLVLLASYPTERLTVPAFLSIYGDRDQVLNRESYERSRSLWPTGAEESVIPGGNHAQFGDYGPQRGDGEAEISSREQWDLTAEIIMNWLNTHMPEGAEAA